MAYIALDTSAVTPSSLLFCSSYKHSVLLSLLSKRRPVFFFCCRRGHNSVGHRLDALHHKIKAIALNNYLGEPSEDDGKHMPADTHGKDRIDKVTVDKSSSEGQRKNEVHDKLIEVFLVEKPTATDWRKLLAFSKEWCNVRPHLYKRIEERAEMEGDPGMKQKLLRLGRKLKEIDEDVQRHNDLLEVIKAELSDINEIIVKRRKDFTREFFEHVHSVAESYYDNPVEQIALTDLRKTCLVAVQAYDNASQNVEAIKNAQLKLQNLKNSPSLDVGSNGFDGLVAGSQRLDPDFMQMATKNWSGAKGTDLTTEEAKDILYQLYIEALRSVERQMPKELRILKYLLTIKDPDERISALEDAFTPGVEMEGEHFDTLYTTPKMLFALIQTLVAAYNYNREGTPPRVVRGLMNPKAIKKLEELQRLIKGRFM